MDVYETQRMDKLNAIYAQEPWGKLAIECGFDPYHTESMAREAFRLCAEKMAALNERVERLADRLKTDDRRIAVLVQAAIAINSLPDDALGYGESGGARWPLRDELLDAIILAMPDPAKARAALERK